MLLSAIGNLNPDNRGLDKLHSTLAIKLMMVLLIVHLPFFGSIHSLGQETRWMYR